MFEAHAGGKKTLPHPLAFCSHFVSRLALCLFFGAQKHAETPVFMKVIVAVVVVGCSCSSSSTSGGGGGDSRSKDKFRYDRSGTHRFQLLRSKHGKPTNCHQIGNNASAGFPQVLHDEE